MSARIPQISLALPRVAAAWRQITTRRTSWPWRSETPWRRFSTFEKVIVANSAIIILVTAAGWWITQHDPETYHYLVDTTFIALAALVGLAVNFALLRAAFAPLHSVLATIRAVEQGNLDARATASERDADALALASAFNAMLDRLATLRDEAAAHVLQGQEEERRRLALELHDQTGQSLTALTLHAEAIAQGLADERSEAAAQACRRAARVVALAQQTLQEVQALSRQLRPPLLDDLGLSAALRWLATDACERLGVAVRVHIHGGAQGRPPLADEDLLPAGAWPSEHTASVAGAEREAARLPSEMETALFRIAQESLTNALRHGEAGRVDVVLRQTATHVTLTVADDGRGFAARDGDAPSRSRQNDQAARRGLGLEGMRERAHLLGGTLTVRTRPAHGCVVRASVPLRLTAAASESAVAP